MEGEGDSNPIPPVSSFSEQNAEFNGIGVARPKKKSLTWDQCTFTSILPSLKEDIAREEGNSHMFQGNSQVAATGSYPGSEININIGAHEQKNWSSLESEMKQNTADIHLNMATSSIKDSNRKMDGGSFNKQTRSTSPVGGDSIPSSSPSSSGSSTTASTGISGSDSTPPVSPVIVDSNKGKGANPSSESQNSRGFISRSTYNPQAYVDTNLETIAEDDASAEPVVKDSPRFINRRRVTLGANLDDVEYAEAMASQLVNGLYSKPEESAARRNSSFEVQSANIHENSNLFGWRVDEDTDGSGIEDGSNEIDVDGLRKQVDSWKSFFDDKQEEPEQAEYHPGKAPTPSRRHSTPPIHINPPSMNGNPGGDFAQSQQQNMNMGPGQMPPVPPGPPPLPPQMSVNQYGGFNNRNQNRMMHQQINAPPFVPGQHRQEQHQQYQQWNEWMNYMNQYQQQQYPPMMPPTGQNGAMYDHQPKQGHTRKGHNRRGHKQGNQRGGNRQACEALAEFRATGNRPTMEALAGHVVEFSKDSHGSRFIQFKMETATPEEKKMLVDEIVVDSVALASHPFGNYVIQNFLLHATPEQRFEMANTFKGNMVKLSTQAHGCRVVQHAFDILDVAQRNVLQAEVVDNIYIVAKNNHGTHVVQKCMNILLKETKWDKKKSAENDGLCANANAPTSTELLRRVEKSVCKEFLRLSVHPHSYRLVQQTLGSCDTSRSDAIEEMMKIVEQYYHTLAVDQHGNFILQHILDNGSDKQIEDVQAFVCSRVLELSQHKFGSHLVEKCLTSASRSQSRAIVEQLLAPTGHNLAYKKKISNDNTNQSTLLLMSKDPYANFVVQRAFDAVDGEVKTRIATQIRQQADLLSRFTYGRHILSHINRADS